jgi:hypothetical protein
VDYRKTGDAWTFRVSLPPGLRGLFRWNGETTPLLAGRNTVDFVRR